MNPKVPLVTFEGGLVFIPHLHVSSGLCAVLQTFSNFCPLRVSGGPVFAFSLMGNAALES